MDADEEDKKLETEEYAEFKENVQLKAIIAGQHAKILKMEIAGVEIQFRAALPKGLRDRLVAIKRAYESGEIEQADEQMYDIISKICLNEPFTNPKVWKYIDIETGEVPDVMKQIIQKMTDLEDTAKRFRNK